jgi:dsDNA-specific endonuclease/ATPase MutS2
VEDNKNKRVLSIELDDDVKKVSITGKNGEEKVIMRQELSEDDLEMATGGNYLPGGGNNFLRSCQRDAT